MKACWFVSGTTSRKAAQTKTLREPFKFLKLWQRHTRSPGRISRPGCRPPRAWAKENIPHDFANLNQQRTDPRNFTDAWAFQSYVERNNTKLRRIDAIMYMTTSSASNIDRGNIRNKEKSLHEQNRSIRLHDGGNIMFPEYSRTPTQRLMYDPSDWLSPDPTKMS